MAATTNAAGAAQLARLLGEYGHTAMILDIRASPVLLHLKTGIAYLGERRLALLAGLGSLADFDGFECIEVSPAEGYAANCVRVNDRVLVPSGNPRFTERLAALGLDPLPLEMSEFRKMDGGLSCLSLRF
jgi:dimethylargininase